MIRIGLLLCAIGVPSTASALGHVQFKAKAGVSIRLEGRDVGVATSAHGLIVRGVPPGARRYEARLAGYTPQYGVVMVDPDTITVHRLLAWQPLATVKISKGQGTLIVETLPADATIQARHLGWSDKVQKGDKPFIARDVPAGRRKFTFCNDVKCLDYWVQIPNRGVRKLLIDFEPGEVFDLTDDFVAGWKRASNKCGAGGDRESCKLACECDSDLTPQLTSLACNLLNEGVGPVAVSASTDFVAPDTCGIDPDSKPGFITITSRRRVTVLVEEDRLGQTPLERLPIAAGCHDITAVTPDGKRHQLTVRIEPGAERNLKLTF